MVFDARVTTGNSYFVLDGGPDPPTEKETSSPEMGVGLRKFLILATPRSAVSAALVMDPPVKRKTSPEVSVRLRKFSAVAAPRTTFSAADNFLFIITLRRIYSNSG